MIIQQYFNVNKLNNVKKSTNLKYFLKMIIIPTLQNLFCIV